MPAQTPASNPFRKSEKKEPARGRSSQPDEKKPAVKKTTPQKKTTATRAKTRRRAPPPQNPFGTGASRLVTGLSLDRKLDIVGVILALVGFLTLLFMLSPTRSAITGVWVDFLAWLVGWGSYVLPLGLVGIGLWLILRHIERIPAFAVERILGVVLLFFNLLAVLHLVLYPPTRADSFALALEGKGGGWIGAFLFELLDAAVGAGGTVVILLAWLVIGIMLMLDVSVTDLFRWLQPLGQGVRLAFRRLAARVSRVQPVIEPAPFEPYAAPAQVAARSAPLPGVPVFQPENAAVHAWRLPKMEEMLEQGRDVEHSDQIDRERVQLIEETLASFGAPAHVVEVNRGPTITQFGVEPDFVETRAGRTRVRVGRIASLADDLALALAAQRIRIQAPVPGKGYIGIEVPNEQVALVALRDVMESEAFLKLQSNLRLALGQDVAGSPVSTNLASMPHLLIAGATGSGKSVCVNSIIATLLLTNTPDTLRLIMVDPKRVELTGYNGIPHLLAPVVVEMEKVIGALQWVTREMDARYQKFHDVGARNILDYNKKMEAQGTTPLPYLVVIIDELADLMILAPDQTEKTITRLAQLARATGIHLVIATQRPSVDVVTGLIKANLPARIAFAVASGVDSRVILDQPGAERLLGSGDMLFQAPDAPAPARIQGVYVSDTEIQRIVQYWRSAAMPHAAAHAPQTLHSELPPDAPPPGIPLKQIPIWDDLVPEEETDPMYNEALDLVRRQGRASISMLQRRLRIGYTRAARLVEMMEDKGIVGPPEGPTQVRQVLDYGPAAPPVGE